MNNWNSDNNIDSESNTEKKQWVDIKMEQKILKAIALQK